MHSARLAIRSDLVGRTAELSRLVSALDEAAGGRGTVMLLAGEPGIGKTRLAEELAATARARNIRVLWGRCFEGEGAPAFWPWVQALRSLVRDLPPDQLRSALGRGAAAVAELVPEIVDVLPDVGEPPPLDSPQARFRLFDAITGFLLAVARRDGPTVLVLDDLHWADVPSILLVQFVSAAVADAGVLLIGAYRDTETDAAHPLTSAVGDISRLPHSLRLQLRGLDAEAVGALIASIGAGRSVPAPISTLAGDTAGNPLFVLETLRLLAEDGRLAEPDGDGLWHGGVPLAVRVIIARRLRHLSEPCRAILAAAGVLGREFDIGTLKLMLDESEHALDESLAEAEAAHVIEPDASSFIVPRYRFTHSLLRETIYEDTPRDRRTDLHQRAGDAIERRFADDPAQAATLAHHFLRAGHPAASARALAHARAGAAHARRIHAYEESVRLDRLALQALDHVAPDDTLRRCALLLDLGEDQFRVGAADTTSETFQQAATLARALLLSGRPLDGEDQQDPAPALLVRAALGVAESLPILERWTSRHHELLEEALAALDPSDRVERVLVLARLARDYHYAAEQARAVQCSAEAVAVARRLGDPSALMRALAARIIIIADPAGFAGRSADIAELLRLAVEHRDPDVTVFALRWNVIDCLTHGDIAAVDGAIARLAQIVEELRHPFYRWQLGMCRASRALLDGDFAEGERLSREAFALREAARDPEAALTFNAQQLAVLWERGEVPALIGLLQFGAQRAVRVRAMTAILASAYAEHGHDAEARAIVERLFDGGFVGGTPETGWLTGCFRLAQACAHLSDADHAAALYARLSPYAGLTVILGWPGYCAGAVAHALGLLAATCARAGAPLDPAAPAPDGEQLWGTAVRHFEDALALHTRMGARGLVAHTHYDYARLLLDRARTQSAGPQHDQAAAWLGQATTMLTRALAAAQELGMARLAMLAAEALQASAPATPAIAPAPVAPAPALPAALTQREVEVLRLLAAGMSNAQIAETLVLSVRTVERHLANLYPKINARNRADAAAFAVRHHLA